MREADLPDMSLPFDPGRRGSNTHAEARHDHDDCDLHDSLQGDGVEVALHPNTNLVQVRLDLLQLEADEDIDRSQKTEPRPENSDNVPKEYYGVAEPKNAPISVMNSRRLI